MGGMTAWFFPPASLHDYQTRSRVVIGKSVKHIENSMTEKNALMQTLEYVQGPFTGDIVKMKAARAFFIFAWLEDKNWHSEMRVLLERARNTDYLKTAFEALEEDGLETSRLYHAVSVMNYIFGWGLAPAEWSATQGEPLIEELWDIINFRK